MIINASIENGIVITHIRVVGHIVGVRWTTSDTQTFSHKNTMAVRHGTQQVVLYNATGTPQYLFYFILFLSPTSNYCLLRSIHSAFRQVLETYQLLLFLVIKQTNGTYSGGVTTLSLHKVLEDLSVQEAFTTLQHEDAVEPVF